MSDQLSSLIDSEPILLTRGGASEGPVWHEEGYLTFVRLRLSQLLRWDTDGKIAVIREDTGNGNGCTLDNSGRLIMCEGGHRRVTRAESDGSINSIADKWNGKRLNKPNDVVCRRSDGSLYFTDPQGPVPGQALELGFAAVFRIASDDRLHLATDECEWPNGLAFSPDESTLYVAISRRDDKCRAEEERGEVCAHRLIRAFDVAPDGGLSNNRIFADMSSAEPGVPDGMKVDTAGRVYCTGSGGIWVIEATGNVLGIIRVPEVPRNLAFGGPELSVMYITAGDSLYRLATKVHGIPSYLP